MPTPLSRTRSKAPRWLIDIDVWGRLLRFSDFECEVTDSNGRTLLYSPGLDAPTYAEAENEYAIRIDTASVDWAKLRAQGTPLERCPVVLRRWFEGQTLEEADAVLFGAAQDVTFGALGEPFECTVARLDGEDTEDTIPAPEAVATARTWPVAAGAVLPEEVTGASYPVIIGTPGGTGYPASPAILVEYNTASFYTSKLLISDGACAAVGETVVVHDLSADMVSADLTVQTTTDDQGRTVSYVAFTEALTSGSALRPYDNHEYAVGWRNTAGGVKYRSTDANGIRGLGLVLLWALRQQTRVPIDVGAQEAQRAFLDHFKVDTFINSPTDPIAWIERELEPIFPIRKRFGPNGFYYEAIRLGQTTTHATAVLDVDAEGIARDGGLRTEWPADGLANKITLRYFDSFNVGHVSWWVVTAEEDTADPRYTVPNLYCRISQATYGVRPVTVPTSVIEDDSTASLVAQWLARRRSLPSETIAYTGGNELSRFGLYETVRLTDSDLYISDRAATVIDRVVAPSEVRLLLELEPDPVVLERRTS